MNTLYIDIDDTLINWCAEGCQVKMHPYGQGSEYGRVNPDVLELFDKWEGHIVLWSGGGDWYAETIARRFLSPDRLDKIDHYESKWNRLPEYGDIFIDDSPFDSFRSRNTDPKDVRNLIPYV